MDQSRRFFPDVPRLGAIVEWILFEEVERRTRTGITSMGGVSSLSIRLIADYIYGVVACVVRVIEPMKVSKPMQGWRWKIIPEPLIALDCSLGLNVRY